jgi:site-specific recombinase XerD
MSKTKPNEVVNVLEEFFEDYLPNSKGLSNNTIIAYRYAFQLLFAYLETQRKCSVKTRNIRRSAIKAFAKFSAKKAFTASLPFYTEVMGIEKKKEPKRSIIRYFTQDEIALLLKLPKSNRLIGQRDVTMLAMLYATGARAQELCDICLKDITLATPTSLTKVRLTGKGNKSRFVTIPNACTDILTGYLRSKNYDVKNETTYEWHLFSSQTNEHMSIKCVEEVVEKYIALAKVQYPNYFRQGNYTPHSFRHSIAVHMLENGESLIAIKAFLGHASIATTIIYAQMTPELANKYLDERGKPLENATTQSIPQSIPETLPFLYRKPK